MSSLDSAPTATCCSPSTRKGRLELATLRAPGTATATAQGSLAAKPARGKVVRGSAAAAERIRVTARHTARDAVHAARVPAPRPAVAIEDKVCVRDALPGALRHAGQPVAPWMRPRRPAPNNYNYIAKGLWPAVGSMRSGRGQALVMALGTICAILVLSLRLTSGQSSTQTCKRGLRVATW